MASQANYLHLKMTSQIDFYFSSKEIGQSDSLNPTSTSSKIDFSGKLIEQNNYQIGFAHN